MRRTIMFAAAALLAGVSHAALAATISGTVSSQKEGAMEGVVVTAKKEGSSITYGVISGEKGAYAFPEGKLAPGKYTIATRAIGYDLQGPKSVELGTSNAKSDITLVPTANLSSQMSDFEWLASIQGNLGEKRRMYACFGCHTAERIVKSKHTTETWMPVLTRMASYSAGTFHYGNAIKIGQRQTEPDIARMQRPTAGGSEGGAELQGVGANPLQRFMVFLSEANLSKRPTWNYPMKLNARPKGRSTKVFITEYDIPDKLTQPHDVIIDKEGRVWYSDFGTNRIGMLDPKSGKITEFPYEQTRPGWPDGNLDLEIDAQGKLWFGRMTQTGIGRFDRDTHKMEHFPVPKEMQRDGTQQAMVAPTAWHVDGKVWFNDAYERTVGRIDMKTGKFDPWWDLYSHMPKGEQHSVYGIYADSKNNAIFMDFSNAYVGMIDAKTGKSTMYPTPTKFSRPRRGRVDAQDRVWFTMNSVDKIGMFDTKTKEIKEWDLPQYSSPYDVTAPDKEGFVWTGNMNDDIITRLNPQTNERIAYLMPHDVNVRRTFVDNSTPKPTFWVGSNHSAQILKLEPLD